MQHCCDIHHPNARQLDRCANGHRYDLDSGIFKLADRYNHQKPYERPLDDADGSQDLTLIAAYQVHYNYLLFEPVCQDYM